MLGPAGAEGLGTGPAKAEAATVVVEGAGYGHGIGMSQYGAFGFANRGYDYRSILAHYYRGTELSQASTRTIRVLLQSGRRAAAFKGASRAGDLALDPARTYWVEGRGGGVVVRAAGGRVVGRLRGRLSVTREGAGAVSLLGRALNGISGGRYRGALEFWPAGRRGVTAVNAAGLDDYVQGVVAGEVPALWPGEALKAQAVAARSYALTTDRGGAVFDQYPDTRSQVYRGVAGEHPRTNAAVAATAGEVLRYRGEIAVTYFFSTSGGRTENVENVFYGARPTPYLTSVEDPFDGGSPRHRWRRTFTTGQMKARLGSLVKGRYLGIEVTRTGVSPRIVWADVIGSRGRTAVRGTTLRARLGLNDTWATFTTKR